MPPADFTIEFIKEQTALDRLAASLIEFTAFALDLETSEWWNRQRECFSSYRLNTCINIYSYSRGLQPIS